MFKDFKKEVDKNLESLSIQIRLEKDSECSQRHVKTNCNIS